MRHACKQVLLSEVFSVLGGELALTKWSSAWSCSLHINTNTSESPHPCISGLSDYGLGDSVVQGTLRACRIINCEKEHLEL